MKNLTIFLALVFFIIFIFVGCTKSLMEPSIVPTPNTDAELDACKNQKIQASLSARLSSTTPIQSIIIMGTETKVATIDFYATSDAFNVSCLTNFVTGNSIESASIEYKNKNGGSENASARNIGKLFSFSNLRFYIPKNGSARLTVKVKILSRNAGAKSGDLIQATLMPAIFYAIGENTGKKILTIDKVVGSQMVVRVTKPLVSVYPLHNTTLGNYTRQLIGIVKITADNAGDIFLSKIKMHCITSPTVVLSDIFIREGGCDSMEGTRNGAVVDFTLPSYFPPGVSIVIAAGTVKYFEVLADISGVSSGSFVTTQTIDLTWGDGLKICDGKLVSGLPTQEQIRKN